MAELSFPHESGIAVRTLPEAFQATAHMYPERVALRRPGDTETITWAEYARRVEAIASGLAALGVGHGDTVGIMLTNRPDFHLVDTAALHLGATPFSIYNTSSPEQIAYLFGNAGNRVVITEQRFLPVIEAAGAIEHVVVVDGPAEGHLQLSDLEANPARSFDFGATWRTVEPGDLATLIYTSGTTGPSKGVEVTHRNVVAELDSLRDTTPAGFDSRIISYLPSAHIADRVSGHYANLMRGIQVTCLDDPREIAGALPDTRPTVFFGVPRVWQKVKAGIEAKLAAEESGVKKALAGWAMGVGAQQAKAQVAGTSPGPLLAVQHRVADALVLSKVRHALGLDQVEAAVTGASAIPGEVLEFFLGLGIPVQEVWGMSETGGASTMVTRDNLRFGTVGSALPGVELKLADDGELLVRAGAVTHGYRGMPEKTAETIDPDGWIATGDIATIDSDGTVTIVDRKKELIINESGKNISPTNIELAMKAASSFIGQAVAIGDNRPYIAALIVLDPDVAAVRAKALGVPDDLAALAARPEVRDEIALAVKAGNAKLSRVEQIKRFVIVPQPWDPGGDELTPTMKLKRKPIAEKYAAEIADLYADLPGDGVVSL